MADKDPSSHPTKKKTVLLDHYYQQAISAEREGKYPAALGLFKICRSFPQCDDGDILFHLGWCYEQQDGLYSSDALEFYQVAGTTARETGCRINANFRAGWLLYRRGSTQEAGLLFGKAIGEGNRSGCRDDPYWHALYWKGMCLEANGRYLEAIRIYQLTQSAAPELKVEAMYRELLSLTSVGRFQEALAICARFTETIVGETGEARFRYLTARVADEETRLKQVLSQQYTPSTLE